MTHHGDVPGKRKTCNLWRKMVVTVGGPGSGGHNRKPQGMRLGHRKDEGKPARVIKMFEPAPQPKGDPNWDEHVTWWWRALGQSDSAQVFQPADWMTAWVAADILDRMYTFGFSASLLREWSKISFQLHVPRLDLLDLAEPEADDDDAAARGEADELIQSLSEDDEINAEILDITKRLGGNNGS
jgi:hypothetical protein